MKYVFAVILMIFGLVQLFNGLAGLPEGIVHMRQGNMAASGAASGGILAGPLFIVFGGMLWGSARFRAKEKARQSAADPDAD